MVNLTALIEKDLKHIWHPCTQMKDFEAYPPLVVEKAKGSYLYTNQGILIDAISSWWCKSLGHGHPAVIAAMTKQLQTFEHVIAANTTHPLLAELGEQLANLSKKQHVFFASDGASAVEIALKMSLHASQLKGEGHKNEFIALSNSYHGETFATLSISDLGLYKKPYAGYGLSCHFISDLPLVTGVTDPLWQDISLQWPAILAQLERVKDKACALIVEPLVQGASGMLCYSADLLRRLALWAKQNAIYLITDEIMTGICRTGEWLAAHIAGVEADLICLSKGLSGGTVPLSCVLIDHSIYELFYADHRLGKSFLHSHTYSANALAVSAAVATLKVMQDEEMNAHVQSLSTVMLKKFTRVADESKKLKNIRCLGAIVAADLVDSDKERIGRLVDKEALKRGAMLKCMGKTLYWLPPLTTDAACIERLAEISAEAIDAAYG